jgi:lipopolysaccharide export system protein LptA
MNLSTVGCIACLGVALSAGPLAAQSSPLQQPEAASQDTGAPKQGGINLGRHDTNAPINVSSDNFIGDFTTKVGTYTGNVVVVQADYKLRADKVRVETLKGDPNKFYADGHVVFVSTSGTATGDNGVYDLTPPRTLTLTGKVVLTKEKDVMKGTVLVVNLVTGESHLTARGMPGGRVTSIFVPKPHPNSGKPSQSPQK